MGGGGAWWSSNEGATSVMAEARTECRGMVLCGWRDCNADDIVGKEMLQRERERERGCTSSKVKKLKVQALTIAMVCVARYPFLVIAFPMTLMMSIAYQIHPIPWSDAIKPFLAMSFPPKY